MANLNELDLTSDAAEKCASACKTFADDVLAVVTTVQRADHGQGFGTLPSGLALARKYSELAVGGPGSLSTMLQAHIAIATKLADTFTEMGQNYVSTDEAAAQRITSK